MFIFDVSYLIVSLKLYAFETHDKVRRGHRFLPVGPEKFVALYCS